jgi:phenylpyruvate tautomerase PptA (4-oxalocrotonate tautomerase family)
MPIMDVRYADGALDADAKAELGRRLTDVLIAMEGGADTEGGRAFAWVFFTAFAAADWWVAGRTDGAGVAQPGKFLVNIFIPEGYMNAAHKAEVHAGVAEAIRGATGSSADGGSILTVIHEVTEGNWGDAGRAISLETIAATVGQPPDGPRMRWSRAYFEAKARARVTAGYPADAGGLPPSIASGQPNTHT